MGRSAVVSPPTRDLSCVLLPEYSTWTMEC